MSFDIKAFRPESVADLADGLAEAISWAAANWFSANFQAVKLHLIAISEAVMQTRWNLTTGRIGRAEAATLMGIHNAALGAQMPGVKYGGYELVQKVLDTATKVLAYAVRNLTGINLAPHLIGS